MYLYTCGLSPFSSIVKLILLTLQVLVTMLSAAMSKPFFFNLFGTGYGGYGGYGGYYGGRSSGSSSHRRYGYGGYYG